jgi:exodeoxyribonuclease-5
MANTASIITKALELLPYEPLPEQLRVLTGLSSFALNGGERDVFVLNGYAGTGKTSLAGAFIKALTAYKQRVVILAPTGRAAKVAAGYSGRQASTIHRKIFRADASDPTGKRYMLAPNEKTDTLFIVDEASLITDSASDPRGSLLYLLIRYVYSAPGCKMILIGDEVQLPPVGQEESTAMNPERLRALGLNPICYVLDQPVRQAADSGIVHNATLVRLMMTDLPEGEMPELHVGGYHDMIPVSTADLADVLSDSYAMVGPEETLIITRSNKRANNFNQAVRNQVMYADSPLQRGDRLVISKNDYFWGKRNGTSPLIANGDTATVNWVGRTEKIYGRYFSEVELQLSDGAIISAKLMLRSLMSEGPAIPRAEMERFYNLVLAEYDGELSEKIAGTMDDPYYNALQAKYAYCVTCHKAQGGQWKHIYIDMGGIDWSNPEPAYFRWLYTALTRSTEKVFLINPTIPCK